MTVYDSLVSRADVSLPEDKLSEIFSAVADESVVLRLILRLRDAKTDELKMRVNAEFPIVYFVDEVGKSSTFPNSDLKQTTAVDYNDTTLYIRELAVIVPIPNSVWKDADFSLEGDISEKIRGAIAKKVDASILFGTPATDSPDEWPSGIFTGMPAAHKIAFDAGTGDLYDNLLGDAGVFAQVELDGYENTGLVGALRLKGLLRGLRADTGTGAPIFASSMAVGMPDTVAGVPTYFPRNGGFDPAKALAIVGDWSQLVYSIGEEPRFEVFNTGVIQDGTKAIVYNLLQQDMVALRVTFRMGWALPTPAQYVTVSGVQYPFAAVTPA
jgi:HK97 family phage major capsid protein